jgi:hypothetical protein
MPVKTNYGGRHLVITSNTAGDAVAGETLFHFHQEGDVVWATYEGGNITLGHLLGRVDGEGRLDLRFQQITTAGELKTGRGVAIPEALPDGRLMLRDSWRFTSGVGGVAVFEEVKGDER